MGKRRKGGALEKNQRRSKEAERGKHTRHRDTEKKVIMKENITLPDKEKEEEEAYNRNGHKYEVTYRNVH